METNRRQDDVIEIDLREIFGVILSHIWIILLCAILAGGIGFGISKFAISPTYESTTKIYILNKQDNSTVTYSDVQLGAQLTKDYAELVQSRYVLEQVISQLELEDMNYSDMKNKLKVSTPTDTRILSITVSDHDPMVAMEIANSIRENAAIHIKNVMDIQAVNVVETANLPTQKASPSVSKWTAIALMLGGFIAIAFYIIRFLLDDTIKTSEDIEKYLGLSTLAMIPVVNTQLSKKSN